MAIQGINSLQLTAPKNWSGLTTDNHLHAIYQRDVQLYSDIMTQIFNMQGKYGLESFLSKYPTKYLDTDADFKWYLKGDDRKAVTITGFSAADSLRPGINKGFFQLKLAERYYQASDFLTFDDKRFGVLLMDDGVADGTDWVFTVQHMKGDNSFFIPPTLMTAGRKVSKQNNADTNVLGKSYGGVEHSSHFEMRNSFSTGSKEIIVPANIAGGNGALAIGMTTPDGEKVMTWTRYQDIKAEWQLRQEKSKRLLLDQSNKNSDGTYSQKASSGFVIKQGSGLREQIAPAYQFYYNTLTLDYIYEVCLNLSINILEESKREFVMMTGERGMIKFHRLIEDKVALVMPYGNEKRLGGSGQELTLEGQYIKVKLPQGIILTVVHMPEYDDPIDNRMPHPEGGFTENYRYTIMNIGADSNGVPNIQRIEPKGLGNKKWYVAGSTSPFGPLNGGAGSSKVDGYEVYYRYTQGIVLNNPLSAAELIPNIVY